jgi:hypothetical protein
MLCVVFYFFYIHKWPYFLILILYSLFYDAFSVTRLYSIDLISYYTLYANMYVVIAYVFSN